MDAPPYHETILYTIVLMDEGAMARQALHIVPSEVVGVRGNWMGSNNQCIDLVDN